MAGRADTTPRPWRCNADPTAVFCALHGDCTCAWAGTRTTRRAPRCALHGDASDHPLREPQMVAPRSAA